MKNCQLDYIRRGTKAVQTLSQVSVGVQSWDELEGTPPQGISAISGNFGLLTTPRIISDTSY